MRKFLKLAIVLSLSFLYSGCALSPMERSEDLSRATPIETLYDYDLVKSSNKKNISIIGLAREIKNANVIFVGEFHSHQGAHKLQLDLLKALYQQNPNLVLSMEQFTRDAQPIVDGYLAGKYGEATLITEGNAWPTYKGSYRATVEFAREHNIPVIAANAPAMFVRCVGKKGVEVLDNIPQEKQSWSARELDLENERYKEKFMSFIQSSGRSHGQTRDEAKKRQMNTYAAQLLRDTTMAESIDAAMKKYPDRQVIHFNGSFHSDGHLGTVAVLETMRPKLSVAVISPVMVKDTANPLASENEYSQGDYLYLLKPLPDRYIDEGKQNDSIRKLIKERMKTKCEL